MVNRLSHTSVSSYKSCPRKYKLRYIERYREKVQRSPLCFGSALDDGLNALLTGKADPMEAFNKAWNKYINVSVKYSKSDVDAELLSNEELQAPEDKWGWYSLKAKAKYMLEAYKEKIIPRIRNVIDVQRKIKIDGSEGDSIIGVVDLICEWEDGSKIIFDNKSSSVKYADNSVEVSEQLGLYCYALENFFNTRKAGFIVIDKHIKKVRTCSVCTKVSDSSHKTCNFLDAASKRCHGKWNISHKANIDVIIQDIPTQMDDKVISEFEDINVKIKDGHFNPNFSECNGKYGRCEFFGLCHYNDDSALIKPV